MTLVPNKLTIMMNHRVSPHQIIGLSHQKSACHHGCATDRRQMDHQVKSIQYLFKMNIPNFRSWIWTTFWNATGTSTTWMQTSKQLWTTSQWNAFWAPAKRLWTLLFQQRQTCPKSPSTSARIKCVLKS